MCASVHAWYARVCKTSVVRGKNGILSREKSCVGVAAYRMLGGEKNKEKICSFWKAPPNGRLGGDNPHKTKITQRKLSSKRKAIFK